MFLFHDGIEPVQIFQARHVAHDRRNVSIDEACGLLQFFLPSPGDNDVRTFFHETLGCGQANAAATARDDCNLTFKLSHDFFLPGFRLWSFGDAAENLDIGPPGSGVECGKAHIGGAKTIRIDD
jgi:hypothetical protein